MSYEDEYSRQQEDISAEDEYSKQQEDISIKQNEPKKTSAEDEI